MDDVNQFLLECLKEQSVGIRSYTVSGQKVWIKKAMSRHGAWKYWPVSLLAWLTGASAVKPVPNRGGIQAVQTEVRRLESLRQAGVRVPELLAKTEQGFMLADMSSREREAKPLVKMMKHSKSAEDCLFWMEKGAEALVSVHEKGCWLSEAFARNILVDGEAEIAFIDFETDPSEVLSFEDSAVRDWMTFIYSCMAPLERHKCLDRGKRSLQCILGKESETIQAALSDNAKRLVKLNVLPMHRWGRDSRSLYRALEVLASFQAAR